ncbi:TIGR03085 family metal-binding protein [Saccharothrix yanglingensis]|uniref:TIGR03085 family protein n=1 Tax=Saccharothrix yanglingensis TaxID=659496 RepID=A0ABU0X307_9PSEU|nr:TIGR03085 family metal-binding protein [Saccharothrix yanglingensis]MDQ2586386.1 TIGR03085 family protein [Saccharothrix yanglingensis]
MGVARDERRLLSDLLLRVGPDAPTLCDPWRGRDLAAHLVLRERRPDAAAGILLGPLAGHTRKVQDGYAAKPWDELVELVRTGPPAPFRLVDEAVNAVEYFVHHEDVRRARPDWEPRSPDPVRDQVLWKRLPVTAKMIYRKSPVGVVLRRPDGEAVVARRGANPVVLTGQVQELLMHVFGRSASRVEYDGADEAVRLVKALDRGV